MISIFRERLLSIEVFKQLQKF